MMQLEMAQAEAVAGGGWFSIGVGVAKGLYMAINAAGATLDNYYGADMTIQIFAAGNMCA